MTTVRKDISPKLRFDVLKRDNFACVYCGQRASNDVDLVIDHIVPVAKGGPTTIDNLQAACGTCNAGKAAGHVLKDSLPKASMYKGRFFHTFDSDGLVQYQGMVVEEAGDVIEVRHFDWLMGQFGAGAIIVPKAETMGWRWYQSPEEMRYTFEKGLVPRRYLKNDRPVHYVNMDDVVKSLSPELQTLLEQLDAEEAAEIAGRR